MSSAELKSSAIAWAQGSLVTLGKCLDPAAEEIECLSKSGIADQRILTLYPPDAAAWVAAAFSAPSRGYGVPTYSTQLRDHLVHSHGYLMVFTDQIVPSDRTGAIELARNAADDAAYSEPESELLTLVLATLELLASGCMDLIGRDPWRAKLPLLKRVVEPALAILHQRGA